MVVRKTPKIHIKAKTPPLLLYSSHLFLKNFKYYFYQLVIIPKIFSQNIKIPHPYSQPFTNCLLAVQARNILRISLLYFDAKTIHTMFKSIISHTLLKIYNMILYKRCTF